MPQGAIQMEPIGTVIHVGGDLAGRALILPHLRIKATLGSESTIVAAVKTALERNTQLGAVVDVSLLSPLGLTNRVASSVCFSAHDADGP